MENSQPQAMHPAATPPEPKASRLRDVLGIAGFIIAVIIGAWLMNALVFRTYRVQGPSMEPTMHTNDRLIVNRIPMTIDSIQGKQFVPERGKIIVFQNPFFAQGMKDEFIVKRVIGLPGERVVVSNEKVLVYNSQNPQGFDPYEGSDAPSSAVSGEVDTEVPSNHIFVIGDNRSGDDSLDSRNGLETIPLSNIVGPAIARTYPFTMIRGF